MDKIYFLNANEYELINNKNIANLKRVLFHMEEEGPAIMVWLAGAGGHQCLEVTTSRLLT